jgi:hypothetical protein
LFVGIHTGQKVRKLKFLVVSPDNKYITFLGDQGTILMISNRTKQWVATMTMNCRAKAACYSPSGDRLYTMGGSSLLRPIILSEVFLPRVFAWPIPKKISPVKLTKFCFAPPANGEVFVWDVEERQCIRKFRDEGCTKAVRCDGYCFGASIPSLPDA